MISDGYFIQKIRSVLSDYPGVGVRSDRFIGFLRSRKASETVISFFSNFSLTGQIELYDGIIFAENEVILRNEFTGGNYIIIGCNSCYGAYALNIHDSSVGIIDAGRDKHNIHPSYVNPTGNTFFEFLSSGKNTAKNTNRFYMIPRMFNTDAVNLMKEYSGYAGVRITRTSSRFLKWLGRAGLDSSFCFSRVMPVSAFPAGASTIESSEEIIAANSIERMHNNSRFIFIGTCPDGGFVVLDKSTQPPSIGYVAFMEIGDNPGWENHYVKVSNSLGEFLHDSNLLGILPDDYYQALELGYWENRFINGQRPCSTPLAIRGGTERYLSTEVVYRVFRNVGEMFFDEISGLLPEQSVDIWLHSSAGFGRLFYQISCIVGETAFWAFARSRGATAINECRNCGMNFHTHKVCWSFLRTRESNLNVEERQNAPEGSRYIFCELYNNAHTSPQEYWYDRLTKSLACSYLI